MSVICVRVQTRQSNQFPQRQSNQFLGMRSPALYGVPSTGMTETTSKTNRRKLRVTQRLGRGERQMQQLYGAAAERVAAAETRAQLEFDTIT
ncbi:hypothetical protein FJT64_003730 [Amphibalanus amphitrite]|uniref:Uncharacterized protein n=1 Tax=Amphibalanus amphitrite TaxID=1232801 RepID=A0A6A4W150_AMPAM|nr:hypothetical protein FJT64_003730 [Amphibalanus amphitrite]